MPTPKVSGRETPSTPVFLRATTPFNAYHSLASISHLIQSGRVSEAATWLCTYTNIVRTVDAGRLVDLVALYDLALTNPSTPSRSELRAIRTFLGCNAGMFGKGGAMMEVAANGGEPVVAVVARSVWRDEVKELARLDGGVAVWLDRLDQPGPIAASLVETFCTVVAAAPVVTADCVGNTLVTLQSNGVLGVWDVDAGVEVWCVRIGSGEQVVGTPKVVCHMAGGYVAACWGPKVVVIALEGGYRVVKVVEHVKDGVVMGLEWATNDHFRFDVCALIATPVTLVTPTNQSPHTSEDTKETTEIDSKIEPADNDERHPKYSYVDLVTWAIEQPTSTPDIVSLAKWYVVAATSPTAIAFQTPSRYATHVKWLDFSHPHDANLHETTAEFSEAQLGALVDHIVAPDTPPGPVRGELWAVNMDASALLFWIAGLGVVVVKKVRNEVVGFLGIAEMRRAGIVNEGFDEARSTLNCAPLVGLDGREVVFAASGGVGVWGLEDGSGSVGWGPRKLVRRRWLGHDGVLALRYTKDAKYIVTAGDDGAARLWRVDSQVETSDARVGVTSLGQADLWMRSFVDGWQPSEPVVMSFAVLQRVEGWPTVSRNDLSWLGVIVACRDTLVKVDVNTWSSRTTQKCGRVLGIAPFRAPEGIHHRAVTDSLLVFEVDGLCRGPSSLLPFIDAILVNCNPTTTAFFETVPKIGDGKGERRMSIRDVDGLKMAVGFDSGLVVVFRKAETPEIRIMDSFCLLRRAVSRLQFSSSGRYLAGLLADNTAFVFDFVENNLVTESFHSTTEAIEEADKSIVSFAEFDEGLIAIGSRGFLAIWDIERDATAYLTTEENIAITALSVLWLLDDTLLVVLCTDACIRVWDVAQASLIREINIWTTNRNLVSGNFTRTSTKTQTKYLVAAIDTRGELSVFEIHGLTAIQSLRATSKNDKWRPTEDVQTKLVLPKDTLAIIGETLDLEESPAIEVARSWGRMLADQLFNVGHMNGMASEFATEEEDEEIEGDEDGVLSETSDLHSFDFVDDDERRSRHGFSLESVEGSTYWRGVSRFSLSRWIPLRKPKSTLLGKPELLFYFEILVRSDIKTNGPRRNLCIGLSTQPHSPFTFDQDEAKPGSLKPSFCILDAFDGRVYYDDGSMSPIEEDATLTDWDTTEDLVFGCGYKPGSFTVFFTRNGTLIGEVKMSPSNCNLRRLHFVFSTSNGPHAKFYFNACQHPLMAFWYEPSRKLQLDMVELFDPKLAKIWATSHGLNRTVGVKKLEDKVIVAALNDRWDAVKFLLKCAPELNLKGIKSSALHDIFASALSQGLHNEVKILLEHGASLPNDVATLQSLMIAALNSPSLKGLESVLKLLVEKAPNKIGLRSLLQGDVVIGAAIQRDLPQLILFCLDFEDQEDVEGDSFGQSYENPAGRDDLILAALEHGWVEILIVLGNRGYMLPHDTNALHAFAPQAAHWFSEFELDENGMLVFRGKVDTLVVVCLGLNAFNHWLPLPSRVDTLKGSQYYFEVTFDEFTESIGVGVTDGEELIVGTSSCFYK
ncbi:hypothetical protein HK096_010921, partial [Nowakowskiella sp. JEL0078]